MKYDSTTEKNIKRHPTTGVYYYVKGRVERSLKTTEFKRAVDRKEFLEDELEGSGVIASRYKVATLVLEYLEEKELQAAGKLRMQKKIREGTHYEIKSVFKNHLLKHFGKLKLSKVSTQAWAKYCERATVRDLANHRKVFLGFLKWCKIKGYRLDVPDVSSIPYHVRRPRRVLKPNELRAIYTNASGALLVFLSLALYNGMRRKEIMTLKWANVSFEHSFLVIRRQHNKLDRERSIPINAVVASVLTHWRESLEGAAADSEWVFPKRGKAHEHANVSGLKTAWATCLRRANLADITWHDFRATFETHAHKSTAHTDTQREKFSDASIDVQKRLYVGMDHDDLRGLETAVKVPGLDSIIENRSGKTPGGLA